MTFAHREQRALEHGAEERHERQPSARLEPRPGLLRAPAVCRWIPPRCRLYRAAPIPAEREPEPDHADENGRLQNGEWVLNALAHLEAARIDRRQEQNDRNRHELLSG